MQTDERHAHALAFECTGKSDGKRALLPTPSPEKEKGRGRAALAREFRKGRVWASSFLITVVELPNHSALPPLARNYSALRTLNYSAWPTLAAHAGPHACPLRDARESVMLLRQTSGTSALPCSGVRPRNRPLSLLEARPIEYHQPCSKTRGLCSRADTASALASQPSEAE